MGIIQHTGHPNEIFLTLFYMYYITYLYSLCYWKIIRQPIVVFFCGVLNQTQIK